MTNKTRVIERYFEELFNRGQLELVDELLAPNYVNHSPGSPDLPVTRDGVRIVVQALRAAFPDLHYTIDEVVEGANSVAVRSTFSGTHFGDLFGLAPTGRRVTVKQMTFERFLGGQIVAHHRISDDLSLLRQLGVMG